MRKKASSWNKELGELAAELQALRVKGKNLQVPGDLRSRVRRVWESGVSFAEIHRATGIQSGAIRGWANKCEEPQQERKFRVLNVVSDGSAPPADAAQVTRFGKEYSTKEVALVFRYERGHAVLEIFPSQLTPELMRVLALC